MRRYLADESIDLVYLDPPFKSNQDYNVLFQEHSGERATAQIKAFEDTWRWDQSSAQAFEDTVERGGRVADVLRAFRTFLGGSDMLAYLSMMAPRLVELRRVLKATGSIYLHCDPTASHYLKMLMDAVFAPQNFRNEIIWVRSTNPKGSQHPNLRYSPFTDTLLFYAKSNKATLRLDAIRSPLSPDELAQKYDRKDEYGPFTDGPIIRSPSMGVRPNLVYTYKGYTPGPAGWRVEIDKLKRLDREHNLGWSATGVPYRKIRPSTDKGDPIGSFWGDISLLNSQAEERLGYPTQKPRALLERIISASSDPDDTVLDPFCGCGTAIDAAQLLGRKWIGIDITHLAITLIKHRLRDAYGEEIAKTYDVIGEPVSLPDAGALAQEDPYQFQFWALGLVGARPAEQKKGADRGIDGRLFFHDEAAGGKTKTVIFSVKAGHVDVSHLRDLRGVLDRENAEIGVLICLEESSKQMRGEAASAGFYESPHWGKFPRLQIRTIAELLNDKGIEYPSVRQRIDKTFKKAPRADVPAIAALRLGLEDETDE